MTQNGRQGRILHRTAADARQIVGWRFANYSVSWRNWKAYGMTQQRWAWAVAMLPAGGVVNYPGDTDAFTAEDLDEALAMIDREVKRIRGAWDLSRLALRMYRRRRRRLAGAVYWMVETWLKNSCHFQPSSVAIPRGVKVATVRSSLQFVCEIKYRFVSCLGLFVPGVSVQNLSPVAHCAILLPSGNDLVLDVSRWGC
jgi:hypothetical protein